MISGNVFWVVVLLYASYGNCVTGQVVEYGYLEETFGSKAFAEFSWQNLELDETCGGDIHSLAIVESKVSVVETEAFEGWRCDTSGTASQFGFTNNKSPNGKIIFKVDFRETMFHKFNIKDNNEILISSNTKFSPKTKAIYLAQNDISHIPKNLFRNLTALKRLGLAKNQLKCLHEDLFKDLKSLEKLDLSDNQIQYLPKDIFKATLDTIENIQLQNNDLKWLSSDQFRFRVNTGSNERLPLVEAQNNNLDKLPKCLAVLDNFNYTTSETLTGNHQPNDTEPEYICNGTEPYEYPANHCQHTKLPVPISTVTKEDNTQTTTVTKSPDPSKPKDWSYYTLYVLFTVVLPVSAMCLGGIIAIKMHAREEENKLRQKRGGATDGHKKFLDELESTSGVNRPDSDEMSKIVNTERPSGFRIESSSALKPKLTRGRQAPTSTHTLKDMSSRGRKKKAHVNIRGKLKKRREQETRNERSVVSSKSVFKSLGLSSKTLNTRALGKSSRKKREQETRNERSVVSSKSVFKSLGPSTKSLNTRSLGESSKN